MTLRVGLTGGIGSGKSAVAAILAELGAIVIDADVLARDVVAPGTDGLAAIAARWPSVVAGGVLDRAALAAIVFGDPAERRALEAITHPRVRDAAQAREDAAPDGSVVVHVVPLLFEGDFWRTCAKTIVVVAPDDVRIARVVARDATSAAAVRARMAAQIDPAEARRRADYTIENDGDLGALRARTTAVYEALRAAAHA